MYFSTNQAFWILSIQITLFGKKRLKICTLTVKTKILKF